MSIRRRRDGVAVPEKHPHMPISVISGQRALTTPEKPRYLRHFLTGNRVKMR